MRRSIGLIVTSGLLPIIALSGAFGFATLRSDHQAVRTGAEATARFAAALAATRLGDGMRSINMIALSPAFDGPLDTARFRILANGLHNADSAWRTLSVAHRDTPLCDRCVWLQERQQGCWLTAFGAIADWPLRVTMP